MINAILISVLSSVIVAIPGGISYLVILAHRHGKKQGDLLNEIRMVHIELRELLDATHENQSRIENIELFLTRRFRDFRNK
jgi:hypothetical protein